MSYEEEPSCAVVGFEFTGDPLLEGEFLPLREGLSVVYGLNGAGKTRLLRGIRAALLGIRSDVEIGMIVRADTEERGYWSPSGPESRPFTIALAQSLAASGFLGDRREQSDEPGTSPTERPMTGEEAAGIVDEFILASAGEEDPELTAELRESRHFLLIPTGTVDFPAWDAWAVADRSSTVVQQAADELRRRVQEADDNLPDENDEPEAYEEAVEQRYDILLSAALLTGEDGFPPRARRRERDIRPSNFEFYAVDETDPQSVKGIALTGNIDLGLDVLDLDKDPEEATLAYVAMIVEGLAARYRHDHGNPYELLAEVLRGRGPRPGDLVRDQLSDEIEVFITRVADELSELANKTLSRMLPEAPVAELTVTPPALRFARPGAEWVFGPARVQIDALSRAERQWATYAINEALSLHHRRHAPPADRLRPAVTLIDEPEAALHRAAEEQVATALVQSVKDDPWRIIIAASHSPELLDQPDAHIIEVQRSGGRFKGISRVQALDLSQREALDRLGLMPSDLLRWPRVILLVEGEHDQVVLETLLGDRLRKARVHLIPLHGGAKLPHTADSQVLFDFTRAHLIGVVDKQRASTLITVWDAAQEAALQGEHAQAVRIVVEGLDKNVEEAGFIRTWLTKALSQGREEARFTPYGLERSDVIDYLPVTHFVPDATDWASLQEEHDADRKSGRSNVPSDFKRWLERRYKFVFGKEEIAAAAMSLSSIPDEFEELMQVVEARSAPQPRWGRDELSS